MEKIQNAQNNLLWNQVKEFDANNHDTKILWHYPFKL